MSAEQEREFDRPLAEHLTGELGPQLGRAGRAFDQMIHAQQEARRQRSHRRWFAIASAGSLIAASVVLAWLIWRPSRVTPPREIVAKTPPATVTQVRDVEQLVAWQTFDEGVEKIRLKDQANAMPVHRLRQEAIQQIEWFDPTDKSKVRMLVPRQDVLLIAQETY